MKPTHKNAFSYIELCKVKIALFSAFSAATGFILSAGHIAPQMFAVMMGIFFLAWRAFHRRAVRARQFPRHALLPVLAGHRQNPPLDLRPGT